MHATTIAINGLGVMIRGNSGSGKSDLALRLIDRGAQLVSDDYTEIAVVGGQLIASAPPAIAGKMEVRGVGIIAIDVFPAVPIRLLIDLDAKPERIPDLAQAIEIEGIRIATLALAAHEASAPIKVEWALRLIAEKQ